MIDDNQSISGFSDIRSQRSRRGQGRDNQSNTGNEIYQNIIEEEDENDFEDDESHERDHSHEERKSQHGEGQQRA